jgi:disulfide oxidoreductase YuzD
MSSKCCNDLESFVDEFFDTTEEKKKMIVELHKPYEKEVIAWLEAYDDEYSWRDYYNHTSWAEYIDIKEAEILDKKIDDILKG